MGRALLQSLTTMAKSSDRYLCRILSCRFLSSFPTFFLFLSLFILSIFVRMHSFSLKNWLVIVLKGSTPARYGTGVEPSPWAQSWALRKSTL